MIKLVEMYQEGIAVKCSYETAIEWQKKIIDYYKEKGDNVSLIDNYHKYCHLTLEWGDCYYQQGEKSKC